MSRQFNPSKLRLTKLPFYEIIDTIVEPRELTCLAPLPPLVNDATRRARYQIVIPFRLKMEHICLIGLAANWEPNSPISSNDRFPVQVLVRTCKADDSQEQPDLYPANADINVNGITATLPELVQSHRANVDNRRASVPVTLTEQCYLSSQRENRLVYHWTDEQPANPIPPGTRFCVTVFLARRLKPDWLLTQIEEGEHFSASQTFSLLSEMFTETDEHIAATEICCSLRCTLSSTRIRVPARSVRCTHVQCFDATNWLEVNARNPKWICPVCNQSAPFESIRVDDFMRKLLADPDRRRDDEVHFGVSNLEYWRNTYVEGVTTNGRPSSAPGCDPASVDTVRSTVTPSESESLKAEELMPANTAAKRPSESVTPMAIDLTDD